MRGLFALGAAGFVAGPLDASARDVGTLSGALKARGDESDRGLKEVAGALSNYG